MDDKMNDIPDLISVSVKKLQVFCNPLGCWFDLQSPITVDEVQLALSKFDVNTKYEDLEKTCFSCDNFRKKSSEDQRIAHIQKIAYFVVNDVDLPIDIDVGVPGYSDIEYIITDGNHRFAAAIIKNQEYINAYWSGSENVIREYELDKHPAKVKSRNRP